jgi:transcriptional regulator with XRE-family HTH domain
MEPDVKRNLDRYRELLARAEASPEYWSEAAAHELIREVEARMARQGISRAELARRLGSSKAYVTKVLGGNVNFTLATMARLAEALGAELQIGLADREAGRQPKGQSKGQPKAAPHRRAAAKETPALRSRPR